MTVDRRWRITLRVVGLGYLAALLLILSLAVLFGIRALGRWGARHDR